MALKHFPGQWFNLPLTAGKPEKVIHKGFCALRMLAYQAGWDKEDVQFIPTKRDGICFRWSPDWLDPKRICATALKIVQRREKKAALRVAARIRARK